MSEVQKRQQDLDKDGCWLEHEFYFLTVIIILYLAFYLIWNRSI